MKTASLGVERVQLELRSFFRSRQAAVFTFFFPVMLLVLFASIFHGEIDDTGVDFRQYFIAGIIASGIVSTSFNNLAISMAFERQTGVLKRLAGTPMPKASYFIGKMGMALIAGIIQTALMLALGGARYGLELPKDLGRWLVLIYILVFGSMTCALIGVVYSRVPKDANNAPAYVTPPYLFLQFISGVFFVITSIGVGLQAIASAFPLRWMASGLRYVFLPDSFEHQEPGGHWNLGIGALVLTAWLVGAFIVAVRTFRFVDERRPGT
jgi:ABC-2 type transport system permease protein